MGKTFPTLYKKISTGAIQYWKIVVEEHGLGPNPPYSLPKIKTEYGQTETESPQVTYDIITEGKNTGKKNATTPYEQAEKEALAKWQKQKKKGYVESIEAAQAEELDDLIEGGVVPMLAYTFEDHKEKIRYPAYVQYKIDGARCIAIIKNGKCTLWSRTRKLITSMPHIVKELEKNFNTRDIILDGEFYSHEYKTDFEKIISLVRQENPDNEYETIQYHVYDVINNDFFNNRILFLKKIFETFNFSYIKLVETILVKKEKEALLLFEQFIKKGYEGAMIRNATGRYEHKRSFHLQKIKKNKEEEFIIIGFEEGRGRLAGHVGSFRCKTKDNKEFLVKMATQTSKLKEYFQNHSLWENKKLTVKFQNMTSRGVPRFPVGKAIRDYE